MSFEGENCHLKYVKHVSTKSLSTQIKLILLQLVIWYFKNVTNNIDFKMKYVKIWKKTYYVILCLNF